MPTCPKCQTENPEDSKFCINCGSTLEVISPSETTTPTPTPQVSPEPPPKSKKPLIIGGIVAILFLAIVGLGAFVVLPKFKPQQPSVSQFPSLPREQPTPARTEAIIKYETDTDNDGIPDFVETEIGRNPNEDECMLEACEGAEITTPKETNILVILDSSGSMAQVAGSQQKMAAAKEALKNYINKISEDTKIGLMVYGHKGSNSVADKQVSCQGIEVVYPLSLVDKAKFYQAVDSFQPTGWTPIADSLQQAKALFIGRREAKNSIVLVSDGIETCGGNPVQAAANLVADETLNIHVIGLGVTGTDRAQLEKIASSGKGDYIQVSDAGNLQEAMWDLHKSRLSIMWTRTCLAINFLDYSSCGTKRLMAAQDYFRRKIFPNLKSSDPEWKPAWVAHRRMSDRWQTLLEEAKATQEPAREELEEQQKQ